MSDFAKKMLDALDKGKPNDTTKKFKEAVDEIEKKADTLKDKTVEELEELVNKRSENVTPVSPEEAEKMDKEYNEKMSSIRIEEEMLASFAKIENEKEELRRLKDEVEECENRIKIMTEKHEEKYGELP